MRSLSRLPLKFAFIALATAQWLYASPTFRDDLAFLRQHTGVEVLTDASTDSQVAVVPAWQGRVMTSTARGPSGISFGWVNRELIASGVLQPHINVFGGEDRIWVGPEGGQFSIFFKKGVPFDLDHWFTPAALDTEPFAVVLRERSRIVFRRTFALTNYSGTVFNLQLEREVRLVDAAQALAGHHLNLPAGVSAVAFESINTLKNTGAQPWEKPSGLLSLWVLGMFNASTSTVVVLPFSRGSIDTLGPVVNDRYFGEVPAQRLHVGDGVMLFRADAKFRSKIGLSPKRASPMLGSYDAATKTLTLISYSLPAHAAEYVNSMWQFQSHPFAGDVVNSYNDGPAAPGGKQLGQFFELESSSPALALLPGAASSHRHQTIHLQGNAETLDRISRSALGVSLEEIAKVFPQ